ncbi:MAG: hypothetical protein AAGB46_15630 [Verrucomicrobiota bacterium]
MNTPKDPTKEAEIASLAERIVKYDLRKMRKEAEKEFDAAIASRDLVSQDAIGQIFNLGERINARN